MLYISKTTLTTSDVLEIVASNKQRIDENYYSKEPNRGGHHNLPLSVASYIDGETLTVKNGYTVTDKLVCYSTCNGNMLGIYFDWSEEQWFFFMSGRRHGIPIYDFFEELIPEYNDSDTHVYISNNTKVSPFSIGVEIDPDNQNLGSTWPVKPTQSDCLLNALNEPGAWRGSVSNLKRILPVYIAAQEEVPIDIATIDFDNVIIGNIAEGPMPSINIEGLTFEGNITRVADYITIEQTDKYSSIIITWHFNDDILSIRHK